MDGIYENVVGERVLQEVGRSSPQGPNNTEVRIQIFGADTCTPVELVARSL